ncbi:MAG: hypothetical protein K2Y29_17630 [Beijerinckiaceae bacterium]|nr:hypothetical protein [Beijerinckiaceae bacterium]
MSYLYPPPSPNLPVVVQKDLGGLVSEYRAMTELYRQQNREVRLHECRSACTLALSLPNVCVYPTSVLRFHSAYHRDTKQVDPAISNELLSAYPPAVRERLGNHLTRNYRSLSGAELIELGVRDCTQPPSETMIARARQAPATTVVASNAPTQGAAPVASLVDGVRSFFGAGGSQQPEAFLAPQRSLMTASVQPGDLRSITPPLPPVRPAGLEEAEEALAGNVQMASAAPLPPRRPDRVRAGDDRPPPLVLPRMITGAQPILPTTFTAYAALR